MRRTSSCYLALTVVVAASTAASAAAADKAAWKAFMDGRFSWKASAPLVTPSSTAADPAVSYQGPDYCPRSRPMAPVGHRATGLRQGGHRVPELHRLEGGRSSVSAPAESPRSVLLCSPGFLLPATEAVVSDLPDRRQEPQAVLRSGILNHHDSRQPEVLVQATLVISRGIGETKVDRLWAICDHVKVHLGYTSNDGRMWRSETKLADFPSGWSQPVLAIQADNLRGIAHLPAQGYGQIPDYRRSPSRRTARLQSLPGGSIGRPLAWFGRPPRQALCRHFQRRTRQAAVDDQNQPRGIAPQWR